MSSQPEKPKIIVDDDWKSRVQAEKEQLKKAAQPEVGAGGDQPDAPRSAATQSGSSQTGAPPSDDDDAPYPPASFSMLVSSFVTQALGCLGQIPDSSGKPMFRPNTAKHLIDMLSVLQEKTKGNLSADESRMLDSVLHELRMAFVAIRRMHEKNAPTSPNP